MEHQMRRRDREITDSAAIESIIKDCDCCRIGFNDNGEVYIVPLNFGYKKSDEGYVFYFHGAKKGRKLDLIAASPRVGFEMDCGYVLNRADVACGHSASFRSVIGNGVMSLVTELPEKEEGLRLLMEHCTGRKDWSFNERAFNSIAVFKLTVTGMSCKEHL